MAVCDCFTSVFADTGENMNLKPNAIREKKETRAMAPLWIRCSNRFGLRNIVYAGLSPATFR